MVQAINSRAVAVIRNEARIMNGRKKSYRLMTQINDSTSCFASAG